MEFIDPVPGKFVLCISCLFHKAFIDKHPDSLAGTRMPVWTQGPIFSNSPELFQAAKRAADLQRTSLMLKQIYNIFFP
jgi:hypothetical protein